MLACTNRLENVVVTDPDNIEYMLVLAVVDDQINRDLLLSALFLLGENWRHRGNWIGRAVNVAQRWRW